MKKDFLKFSPLTITNKIIYLPQLDDNKQQKRVELSEIVQLFIMNFNNQIKGIIILKNSNSYDIISNEYLGDIERIKQVIQKLSQKNFELMSFEKYSSVVGSIFTPIDKPQNKS